MWIQIGLFLLGAGLIGFAGPRLSRKADALGKITGLGQTLAGILLLGASTSLPGLIVSAKAALAGQANLAISNSIGGIAAQTFFLAMADLALRKKKITHASNYGTSLLQATVVISLLSLVALSLLAPKVEIWHIHPATPIILISIVIGFKLIQNNKKNPRWQPKDQSNTNSKEKKGNGSKNGKSQEKEDEEKKSDKKSSVYKKYALYLIIVGAGGWLISYSGGKIMESTGLSQVVMGATFMAIATSLPELVTAITAVRAGKISLALGDIIGGNAFDTIMIAIADIVYFKGSIFAAASPNVIFLVALSILMTGIMLVGFIRRDKKGFKNLGIESAMIIIIYLIGIFTVIFARGVFMN